MCDKFGHTMIQLVVDPLLAAIARSKKKLNLYEFISLSYRFGGILAHSSL